MKNLSNAIRKHETSTAHINACLKLKLFNKVRIDTALSQARDIEISQFNDQVRKNREILLRLIEITLFLAKQELSFRGHDEGCDSENRGNFEELCDLLTKFDSTFASHLEKATVFRGNSKEIQNDLIDSIASIVASHIQTDIRNSTFYAIECDETTDVATSSQLSLIVRLVKEGEILERFLGFIDLQGNKTAQAICTHILQVLSKHTPEQKLICQTYDGAASMSGCQGGVQALVRRSCPYAIFIHCYAHKLNLVLSQTACTNKSVRIFFSTLSGLHSFFSCSPKRITLLRTISNQNSNSTNFPAPSETRWNFRKRAIDYVVQHFRNLQQVFTQIIDQAQCWDSKTVCEASGFNSTFGTLEFAFFLCAFHRIFSITDVLQNFLQSSTISIGISLTKVQTSIDLLVQLRSDLEFTSILQTVLNLLDNQYERSRADPNQKPEEFLRPLYFECIDVIVTQMTLRFADLKSMKFVDILDHRKYPDYKQHFPDDLLNSLFDFPFQTLFDKDALRNELVVLFASPECSLPLPAFLSYIHINDLYSALPQISKLVQLISTLPISTASVERSFSCLKRIKSALRNKMSEERLSNLALISIEKSLALSLNKEEFIDHFAKLRERRLPLFYK